MRIEVAKIALEYTRARRRAGEIPTMLGLPGLLALMWDNIRRFNESTDHDEIAELASNGLVALELSLQATRHNGHQEIEDIEEPDEHPPVYDGWRDDPEKARGLKDWAIESGNWNRMNDAERGYIEEVAASYQEATDDQGGDSEPA